MFRNYLKIALRNLWKEKLYGAVNILGLSIGTAVAVLMILYVSHEWSYDSFHAQSDRIYRAWVKEHYRGDIFFNTNTPFILGSALADNFPEVEEVVQYLVTNSLMKRGEFSNQENVHLVTPSFMRTFDFAMIDGDESTALEGVRQAVLTPAVAVKYFGDADPIGQSFSLQIGGEWQEFMVSGIIEEAPGNSSIQYDVLIPFENTRSFIPAQGLQSWTIVFPETYILLKKGTAISGLESKIQAFVDSQVAGNYDPGDYRIGFQPLTGIHLNNEFPVAYAEVSDGRYPYLLGGIAILILLLACINFISLAVGRSLNRAKEVGVRKVTGANRFQVMQQFWSEAVLISMISVGLGVLIAELLLPFFNTLSDKDLILEYNPGSLLFFLGLGLLLGVVAGSYPAIVVSGFSPVRAIKGKITNLGASRYLILRGLTGTQFVLSIVLLSCTFIIRDQLRFLQNKNLGYEEEQMLVLPYQATPSNDKGLAEINEEVQQKAQLLKDELAGKPEILAFATSTHTFGTPGWTQLGFTDPSTQKFRKFYLNGMDEHFIPTMGIELLAGRNFSRSKGTDVVNGVIINEAFAREFGLEDGVGKNLPKPFDAFQVVGITKNFNFQSLHQKVDPLVMAMTPAALIGTAPDITYGDRPVIKITMRIAAGATAAAIPIVQDAWKKVAPEQSFNFFFLDEAIHQQYLAETRLGKILTSATLIALLVACLGLFGMATLNAVRRTKEIGLRKVLGASTTHIVWLLNSQSTRMILVALLIATPVAYFLTDQWLEDFAYRISVNPLVFILSGILVLVVAWLAIGYQSLKAAGSNPVKALRYE